MSRLAKSARRLGSYAMFYAGLFLFGLFCLLWSLPAGMLYRIMPRPLGARCGQFAIMAGFRLYIAVMVRLGIFRCDLGALDALHQAGPLVIAPNHPSLLDVVLVASRLPRVVCITKPSIWDNPFLGGGARLAGYIRNDAPLNMIKRAIDELRDGHQLLVFPEGTRTVHRPVDPFKGGFLLMARKAGVPVQTVFIESNSGYLGKGWPLFRKPELPGWASASMCRPTRMAS
jgi:1-acyl-sn-glycerol-3-phosphate acyltransferase